ncbi:hypothetical protein BDV98DRAFT_562512 [Pterulicium gracile]|uniref:Uncharacterized protein n=1 Tax=Pterulicium gracile TaxID=1884261 RepID=A0A5C3QVQ3_9AGAR|nr:hypothetical protein BDV98DRAFT_562512 [Pterula gracilis]
MPRPTTPSTLPPTGQPAASRSPSMTPSVTKLPPRPRTSLTVSLIEDDERRLRKAISVPLPASSPPPFASPDRSPQRSPLPSPVLSAMPPSAINTRGTSPQIPLQSVETHASPKTSRSSMPSLSYTPVPIARNLPQRSPSPTRSSVVKPFIPRATPQTPSALSTPGSMRRRSFSPRIRSPSPSFELDNSTLPSLPSSSDGSDVEIELPQQPQTGSEVVLVSAFSDDSTEPEPIISIGSQEPSFSSALHSSFRSQPREEASSEMFGSLPVNTHPTTPRGVPRTPLPPVTPAPPGAFIFPGNTPARPGHSRAKGSRSTSANTCSSRRFQRLAIPQHSEA